MPIPIKCPSCGKKGSVPTQFAGRQVKCPKCGGRLAVKDHHHPATPERREPAEPGTRRAQVQGDPQSAPVVGALGSTPMILALTGACLLFVGVFTPIVSAPVIGSITYFQNGEGDGVIVAILAAISALMTLLKWHRTLWITGLGSLMLTVYSFTSLYLGMAHARAGAGEVAGGNDFGGLAQVALNAIQLQWGWAILVIGAILVIAAAVLTEQQRRGEQARIVSIVGLSLTPLTVLVVAVTTWLIVDFDHSSPPSPLRNLLSGSDDASRTMQLERSMDRMASASNLRSLTISLNSYANDNGAFPPQAICDRDGSALLSWRVAILPYLGENNLFKRFRLDEPWDSPHNLQLLDKMPDVYRPPSSEEGKKTPTTTTRYKVFVGGGAIFGQQESVSPSAIADADGTSATILLVEALESVPWTKPEDILFDPAMPLPSFVGDEYGEPGFNLSWCDGSTRFVKGSRNDAILRAAITWNGGEPFDLEELRD